MDSVDPAPSPLQVIEVTDGQNITLDGAWLLKADFAREGSDLLLTGEGGQKTLLVDYFSQQSPPDLQTDFGAVISGELAGKLAGPVAPAQFAQATPSASSAPIGRIESISGTAEATRADGTKVTLQQGSSIFSGDVLETGGDSAIGIILADDSTLSLAESGRMVMDEVAYDPGAQDGNATISIVQGVFSFVSGQIAKTGPDAMVLKTPVATLGIRGTKVAGSAAAEGQQNTISLLPDADGSVGEIAVFNGAGTVLLNVAGATTQLTSAFQAPPAPVIVPIAQIQQQFSAALNTLPPPPVPQNNNQGNQGNQGDGPEGEGDGPPQEGEAPPEGEGEGPPGEGEGEGPPEEGEGPPEEGEGPPGEGEGPPGEGEGPPGEGEQAVEGAPPEGEGGPQEGDGPPQEGEGGPPQTEPGEEVAAAPGAEGPGPDGPPQSEPGQEEAASTLNTPPPGGGGEGAPEQAFQQAVADGATQEQAFQAAAQAATQEAIANGATPEQAQAAVAAAQAAYNQAIAGGASPEDALNAAGEAAEAAVPGFGGSPPQQGTNTGGTQNTDFNSGSLNLNIQGGATAAEGAASAQDDSTGAQNTADGQNNSTSAESEANEQSSGEGDGGPGPDGDGEHHEEGDELLDAILTGEGEGDAFLGDLNEGAGGELLGDLQGGPGSGDFFGPPEDGIIILNDGDPNDPNSGPPPTTEFSEVLNATTGNDTLIGGDGNTQFAMIQGVSLGGIDTVDGGLGTDEINFRDLSDLIMVYNANTDVANYATSAGSITGRVTLSSIEQLFAGVSGESFNDATTGGGTLNSGGSGVRLSFSPADTDFGYIAAGTTGADTITLADNTVIGPSQTMDYALSANHTVTNGAVLGSLIFGRGGNDTITGSSGGDTIFGGAGDDIINNGLGSEGSILIGGIGNDTFNFSAVNTDTFIAGGSETDTINLNTAGTYELSTIGVEIINGHATGDTTVVMNNVLTGSTIDLGSSSTSDLLSLNNASGGYNLTVSNTETINGSTGADTIILSGSNNITFKGGDGADIVTASSNTDTFKFNATSEIGDTINSFASATDKFEFTRSAFNGDGNTDGALDALETGAGLTSSTGAAYFVFDSTNNDLYYDADASGGGTGTLVADLDATVVQTDITFVA